MVDGGLVSDDLVKQTQDRLDSRVCLLTSLV